MLRPHCLERQSMRQVHDVYRPQRGHSSANTRGVIAFAVALDARSVRLIEGRPMFHAISEPPNHQMRVIGEPGGNIPVLPATAMLKRLRQIPVIETDPR